MQIKQFIYTSFRAMGDASKGYDIFAATPGISENDSSEIISQLQEYPIPNDARLRASDVTQSLIDELAPKNYAYLELSSGKRCIACVSLNDKDYSGRTFPIYLHAVIFDDMQVNPIEFIDSFRFRHHLTDDEFNARVKPPILSESFVLEKKSKPSTFLTMQDNEMLLNAILTSLEEKKQILFNADEKRIIDILREIYSYLPSSITRHLTFATYLGDQDSARAYKISHIANDFPYESRILNNALIICDFKNGNYSKTIKQYKISPYLIRDSAKIFLETCIKTTKEFAFEKVANIYEFLYTDKYLSLTEQEVFDLSQDDTVQKMGGNSIVSRITSYLHKNNIKSNYQLYSVIYGMTSDKDAFLKDVILSILLEIKEGLPLDVAKKAVITISNLEIEDVIYKDYSFYRDYLLKEIEHKNILLLTTNIFKSIKATQNAKKTSEIYDDVYNALSKKSLDSIKDVFLPSISFDNENWLIFFKKYFHDVVVSAQSFISFLSYLKSINESQLSNFQCFDIVTKTITQYQEYFMKSNNLILVLNIFSQESSQYYEFFEFVNRNLGEKAVIDLCLKIDTNNSSDTHNIITKFWYGSLKSIGEKLIKMFVVNKEMFFVEYLSHYYAKGLYRDLINTLFDSIQPAKNTQKYWPFIISIFKSSKGIISSNDAFIDLLMQQVNSNFWIEHTNLGMMSVLVDGITTFDTKLLSPSMKLIALFNCKKLTLEVAKDTKDCLLLCLQENFAQKCIISYYLENVVSVALMLFQKKINNSLLEWLLQLDQTNNYNPILLQSAFQVLKAKEFMKLEAKIKQDFGNKFDIDVYFNCLSEKQKKKIIKKQEKIQKDGGNK